MSTRIDTLLTHPVSTTPLRDAIDAEAATAAGVGDIIELAQELAQHAGALLVTSNDDVLDPEARKRLAQAMMLLELADEAIGAMLAAHDASMAGKGSRS